MNIKSKEIVIESTPLVVAVRRTLAVVFIGVVIGGNGFGVVMIMFDLTVVGLTNGLTVGMATLAVVPWTTTEPGLTVGMGALTVVIIALTVVLGVVFIVVVTTAAAWITLLCHSTPRFIRRISPSPFVS